MYEAQENGTPMPKPPVEGKKENILVSLKNGLGDLWKNPVTRYSSIGASFRFFAMFACDYFLPAFFLMMYPLHRKQFGILYCLCVATGGLVSSITGGILADKFGPKNPKAYSKICMWGSALALPAFVASVLVTNNFYLAMAMTYLKYLIGECFWSPNITMI